MDSNIQKAFDFFSPGKNNFWRWADQGEIIEWKSGETIVYRRELRELLSLFKGKGLPPTEAVLMILDACKDNWDAEHFVSKLNKLAGFEDIPAPVWMPDDVVAKLPLLKKQQFLAIRTLIEVSRLPKEMRSNDNRTLILLNIFKYAPTFLTPAVDASGYLYVFGGDIFTNWVKSQILHDHNRVAESIEALSLFPDWVELEELFSTGLEQIPEPAPLPQPEPIPSNDDLLTQLSQDPQTAGLARLTKRLIAALNIPPHTQGASDQPLGGVSDISNRGDFDRLLLSELANDDDTLSARLVNNEALYLRRETPPDPQVQERVILVDTSLRLWGMPRLFAVSAALGCALNNHQKAGISAFALGKEIIGPNALATKEEVIHFLEQQSPVLHSGEALRTFFRQQPRSAQRAVFFITSEEVMADKNFSLIFAEQQQHLDYLLVLSRTGTLLFYRLLNGQRSLMSTSVFDLNELLFKQLRTPQFQSSIVNLDLPNALKLKQFPLFIPMMKSQILFSYLLSETSAIAVTINFELHYWPSKNKGSILIAKNIPAQKCWFGQPGPNQVTVLGKLHLPGFGIRNRIYVFDIEQRTLLEINLDEDPVYSGSSIFSHLDVAGSGIKGNIVDAQYENESWCIKTIDGPESTINYYTIDIKHNYIFHSSLPLFKQQNEAVVVPNLLGINKIINNGYSVHHKIDTIGISRSKRIKLNDWEIQLNNISLALGKDKYNLRHFYEHLFVEVKPLDSTKYGHIIKTATLNNKVEAFVDNRGFLYLRAPHTSLPEVCFTLISVRGMAAYASDLTYTGNRYFIPDEIKQFVRPVDFYQKYIQPYIELILQA